MQMFVPVPDECDSGAAFTAEVMVPFRIDFPVWRDPEWEQRTPSAPTQR